MDLTPESCLELAQALYGRAPQALVVSVRGYQFGYRTELSAQTAPLIDVAVARIVDWIGLTGPKSAIQPKQSP